MPQSPCAVRRLKPGDVEAFHALNRLFAENFEDEENYLSAPPDEAWLESLLTQEHIIPLVAEADGQLTGGLVAYVLDKFEQQRREIYIYDLAVDVPARRQGVATALIAHLRQIAGSIGAWVVYVQADDGDEPAIALYTKLGVREDVLHFDMTPLPADGQDN